MSVGNRIRYFRQKNNLKQKELGLLVGLTDVSAEVRINQYESGARTPRADMIQKLADVFHISPLALIDSDVYSGIGFMHTMFAIEDTYDLEIMRMGSDVVLRFKNANVEMPNPGNGPRTEETCLLEWAVEYMKWQNGEISKEEYDQWRYTFPDSFLAEAEVKVDNTEELITEERMPTLLKDKISLLKREREKL